MSFLQMRYAKKKINIKPSPAKKIVLNKKLLSQIKQNLSLSVKRIFGFISALPVCKMDGSMSIEAAVLLPLFLFFFLHLASVMEMLRLHSKLETALWGVGNQMTVYIDDFAEIEETVSGGILSYLIVHGQIKAFLGEDYLDNSPLVYGADGLNYLKSDCLDQEECVDIEISYRVEPQVSIFPFGYYRMYSRYYGRAWTGYDIGGESAVQKYVYVTPEGEVWHSTPECTYLSHEVEAVKKSEIRNASNVYGQIYELCELCRDQASGKYVYVTQEGEKYHFSKTCSAIYKRIIAVKWSEDLHYRFCSRCAGQS